jgi:hypothetical protein
MQAHLTEQAMMLQVRAGCRSPAQQPPASPEPSTPSGPAGLTVSCSGCSALQAGQQAAAQEAAAAQMAGLSVSAAPPQRQASAAPSGYGLDSAVQEQQVGLRAVRRRAPPNICAGEDACLPAQTLTPLTAVAEAPTLHHTYQVPPLALQAQDQAAAAAAVAAQAAYAAHASGHQPPLANAASLTVPPAPQQPPAAYPYSTQQSPGGYSPQVGLGRGRPCRCAYRGGLVGCAVGLAARSVGCLCRRPRSLFMSRTCCSGLRC